MEYVFVVFIVYVIGAFWYAGANSMADMNWLVKVYRKYKK